jgi:L-lactate dehydrogenase
MDELKPKISIIGAGNVGVRYAYASIINGLARKIVLVDVNKEKLMGEVMDLSHGMPYIPPVDIVAGDYEDIYNSDLVVITAGKNQSPGETRLDLVNKNVELFKLIIPKIMDVTPDSILLIVSNPVDILSYVSYKLSRKPSTKVMGSGTTLDTARFRFLLGQHCGINARNVHAYILGEHGDSEFPIWSSAMIGGMLIKDYCLTCSKRKECNKEEKLKEIFKEVKDSAYEIIKKKGETSYGIGLTLARITRAILNDENTILPVSTLINNIYGVNDLYLSLPCIINRNGIKEQLVIELNEEEEIAFRRSAKTIKGVIDKIQIN